MSAGPTTRFVYAVLLLFALCGSAPPLHAARRRAVLQPEPAGTVLRFSALRTATASLPSSLDPTAALTLQFSIYLTLPTHD